MIVPLFLGILFVLSILTFFFAFDRKQKNKKSLMFIFISLLIGAVIGYLISILYKKGITLELSYKVVMIFLFCFGIVYVWWLYNKVLWTKRDLIYENNDSFWLEAFFSLILTIGFSIGVVLVLYIKMQQTYFDKFWSVSLFFPVPFLIYKAFDFYMQIPEKHFKNKWIFTKNMIGEKEWVQENIIRVKFAVIESWYKPGMKKTLKFEIPAPREAALGEVFRLAVRNYNHDGHDDSVQDLGIESENTNKFWWLFKLKAVWNRPHTWFPNIRYLDPFESTLSNGLRSHDLVKVIRITNENSTKSGESIIMGLPIK